MSGIIMFILGFVFAIVVMLLIWICGSKCVFKDDEDYIETSLEVYHFAKDFPDSMKWGIERNK